MPNVGGKKRSVGGNKQEEQKVSLTKTLAPYHKFQTGEDLSNGGYKVGQAIAAGADGDVFRAVSLSAKKEVAVKKIRITSDTIKRHVHQEVAAVFHARKMYCDEAIDLNSLGHPCIVAYLDWFGGPAGVDREVYIVMELCNFGIGDLIHTGNVMRIEYEKMVKSRTPLDMLKALAKGGKHPSVANAAIDPKLYRFPQREILKVLFQMLSALAFLNRHGIFHRDVKSENILWKHDHPNEGFYKLADFGVAFSESDTDGPKRHDDCGTLWTMAPELLGRRPGAGPSCDIWSLGVVLFEMSFYEKPFNSLELLSFRNAGSESLDGFWNSICGEKKATGGATPGSRFSSSNPSSPKSAGGGGFGRAERPRLLSKQASATALPSVNNKSGFGDGPMSPPTSPVGRLGKALSRRTNELNASAPTPLSLSRQGTGDEEPMTPVTPASGSGSPSENLRTRKRAFLRKRSSLRWIYSDELRNSIFEDMLDEDATSRPTPADMLASGKVQGMLASYDIDRWSSYEDVNRGSSLSMVPTLRPDTPAGGDYPRMLRSVESLRPSSASAKVSDTAARPSSASAKCPDTAAPTDVLATGVLTSAPTAVCLTGNALERLTPEAFLAVLKADRKFDAAVYSQQNYEAVQTADSGVMVTSLPRPAELT